MMKKIYCIKYNKYGKFQDPKLSYMFDLLLVIIILLNYIMLYINLSYIFLLLFVISIAVMMGKYLKKKDQLRYPDLINNIYHIE